MGKCTSFSLTVPCTQLFTNEINLTISIGIRHSRPLKVSAPLHLELDEWLFSEIWSWLSERHHQIEPFSDASSLAWGGVLGPGKRCQVDTLYLDFSKAFDVDHKPLLTKLQRFGITGNLLRWLNDYLTDRKQRVTSQALPILSGVPQGSILGPLLFLIYVNALPASVSTQSTTALFTDGTKCYRAVRTTEDGSELQCDLMNLIGWCNTWRMDFNVSKCGVLSFTRSHKPICYPYEHLGTKIKRPDTMKDLGITITGDLK